MVVSGWIFMWVSGRWDKDTENSWPTMVRTHMQFYPLLTNCYGACSIQMWELFGFDHFLVALNYWYDKNIKKKTLSGHLTSLVCFVIIITALKQ